MTADVVLAANDEIELRWQSEADLRDSLADFARLHGWQVQTELVVPGWGRPDLVLSVNDVMVVVELKVALTAQSRIRKAFQQADAYRRCLPAATHVLLVAGHINRDLASEYATAFRSVTLCAAGELMGTIAGYADGIFTRCDEATRQVEALESRLALARAARDRVSALADEHLAELKWKNEVVK